MLQGLRLWITSVSKLLSSKIQDKKCIRCLLIEWQLANYSQVAPVIQSPDEFAIIDWKFFASNFE